MTILVILHDLQFRWAELTGKQEESRHFLSRILSSIMTFTTINKFNNVISRSKKYFRGALTDCVSVTSFLPSYYRLNDLMWQDGLLIDFLQKKVADKWIRRFLVCSSYLFSERVLFKFVVRFYIDFIVWPMTNTSIFEFSTIASMLTATLLALMLILTAFNLNYLYILLI